MAKKHEDTSVSLHPLTFEHAHDVVPGMGFDYPLPGSTLKDETFVTSELRRLAEQAADAQRAIPSRH
jgi:hypothetical protein